MFLLHHFYKYILIQKVFCIGFPWWLSGKESAYQCKKHGFDPWARKILHGSKRPGPRGEMNKMVPGYLAL